ncbi:MAG: hypothetical protein HY928_15495 [Elusimicrobia bacterium]|nr:hypothetical protein [Elusimicrobiota bacterium]
MEHSTEKLLRHYEQGERAALEALGRRLDETEARLVEQAAQAPERLRHRFDELSQRLRAAKEETDRRAESFREELLSAEPSPDAFRARLVMLEMEHASRIRVAEEGMRLIAGEIEEALAAARTRVKSFCDEARAGLSVQVQPERMRLIEALAESSRRLAAAEKELAVLREKTSRGSTELEDRVEHLERELAASRAQDAEDAKARRAAEETLAAVREDLEKAERASAAAHARTVEESHARRAAEASLALARNAAEAIERSAQGRIEEAEAGGLKEREELRRRLQETLHELEAARSASRAAAESTDQRRAAHAEHERVLAAARGEADRAVDTALTLRRELEKRESAMEELRRRLATAEGGEKAMRREGEEAQAELRRLRAEHSSLVERLNGAVEEARAARAALEDGRKELREALEKARAAVARVRDHELEPRPPRAPAAAGPEPEDYRAKLEALRAELEAQRAETRAWQRRLLEADAARDRSLAETRAGWSAEKEGFEEALAAKTRETSLLRAQLETTERTWGETLARQDAARMQEIFKLRAEVQQLRWKVKDLEGKGPGAAQGPGQ